METADNPAHRRSVLLRLTRQGERCIARMKRREARRLDPAAERVSPTRARQAAATLRQLREAVED